MRHEMNFLSGHAPRESFYDIFSEDIKRARTRYTMLMADNLKRQKSKINLVTRGHYARIYAGLAKPERRDRNFGISNNCPARVYTFYTSAGPVGAVTRFVLPEWGGP
jgi:hypothetical protein